VLRFPQVWRWLRALAGNADPWQNPALVLAGHGNLPHPPGTPGSMNGAPKVNRAGMREEEHSPQKVIREYVPFFFGSPDAVRAGDHQIRTCSTSSFLERESGFQPDQGPCNRMYTVGRTTVQSGM